MSRPMSLNQLMAVKAAAPAFNTRWFKYGYLNAKEKTVASDEKRELGY